MQKYNLKSCPLCSNNVNLRKKGIGGGASFFVIECPVCEVKIVGKCGVDEKIIVNRWNTRAQTLDCVQKLNNERGSGRKSFITKEMIDDVLFFGQSENMSYRKIADMENISVGTVHKIISEQKKKDEEAHEKNKKPA